MATVELRIRALPAHVRTARLVAAAVARRCGVDDAVIDEVKLAVGEACSRAVALHEQHAPDHQVIVELTEGGHEFLAAVIDCGPPGSENDVPPDAGAVDLPRLVKRTLDSRNNGPGGLGEPLPAHLRLAVIAGLVDELAVERDATGTVVRMRWVLGEPQRNGG
jgi:serine/threonine-protein kinase RsbW